MDTYQALEKIGLSKQERQCYEYLCDVRAARGPVIAAHINKIPVSAYRTLRQLAAKGFVRRSQAGLNPKLYYVIYLEEALQNYAQYQRQQVQPLLNLQEAAQLRRRLAELEQQ